MTTPAAIHLKTGELPPNLDLLKLQLALESASLGTWVYTFEDGMWTLDQQAQKLYHTQSRTISYSELASHSAAQPADIRDMFRQAHQVAERGGNGRLHHEHRVMQPDGSYRWIASWAQIETEGACANRKPVRMVGVSQDITDRKSAEFALRESEERLRLFVEHAPAALAMFDRHMCYLSVSQRWINDFKLPVSNLRGLCHYDVFPDVPEHWKEVHQRALAGEIVRSDKDPFVRADGRVFWLQWEVRPWHDHSGQVAGIVIFSEDITHRVHAEEAFKRTTGRFKLLSEIAGRLLISSEPQKLVEELCAKVMQHLQCDVFFNYLIEPSTGHLRLNACSGLPESIIPGITQLDLHSTVCGCVARDRKCIIARDIQHTGDPRLNIVRPYGIDVYCCHPLMAGGELIGTLGFGAKNRPSFSLEDVELMRAVADQVSVAMERIRNERNLRQSELQLRTLANTMPQLVWTARPDGVVDFYNFRAIEFAGITREQDNTWQWRPVVHPDDLQLTIDAWNKAVREGSIYQIEHRIRMKNDTYVWYLSRALPQRDSEGNIVKWFGTATEIQAIKEAEAEVRRAQAAAEAANAAKDHFLAVLSHELRTPLTPVLTMAQALLAQPSLPSELKKDIQTIKRNAELEARLIDDLLDLTRITRGKIRLVHESVNMTDIIQHTLDICTSEIQAKELKVSLRQEALRHWVIGDGARLHQVLWNLVKNAIKFTDVGGSITISTRNIKEREILISVCDSGIGITPDALPRLFNAFEQANTDHRFGGLGLGLAISRKLAELHGGSLTAHSEGRHKGATFDLCLPAINTPATAGHHTPDPTASTSPGLRILLVEDHLDTARTMTRVLQTYGHSVRCAHCVQEGLALATSCQFDLLLSDIGLPDGTGHDLMRALRGKISFPAIALTGYGMEDDIVRSREAGFVAHLTKPVNLGTLEQTIREVTKAGR